MSIKYISLLFVLIYGCTQNIPDYQKEYNDAMKRYDKTMAKHEAMQKEFESLKPSRVAAWVKKNPTNKQAIQAAKQIIMEQLKDPDSVKFSNVTVQENNKVIGYYNAKNSYGGYVGYKKFVVESEKDIILP